MENSCSQLFVTTPEDRRGKERLLSSGTIICRSKHGYQVGGIKIIQILTFHRRCNDPFAKDKAEKLWLQHGKRVFLSPAERGRMESTVHLKNQGEKHNGGCVHTCHLTGTLYNIYINCRSYKYQYYTPYTQISHIDYNFHVVFCIKPYSQLTFCAIKYKMCI